MKTKNNFKKRLCLPSSLNKLKKSLAFSALIIAGSQNLILAQTDSIVKPSWYFGVVGGANFNFYEGSTQKLNNDLTVPSVFHKGNGLGLFLGPLIEFHRPESRWGVMLQGGYDSRKGTFKQILTPCNCPTDLTANLNYITVEPSLRFAPFKSDLYLYVGPRFAYNLDKSFTYHQKTNPAYPEQTANPEIKGNFSDINSMLISAQVGMGYDIQLSSKTKLSQFVLSPYVSFQPYFGQSPRTIESWNVTTVRAGIAFKFGRGHIAPKDSVTEFAKEVKRPVPFKDTVVMDSKVAFNINSPSNIPSERRVRETFPLRNYIFFDAGSTQIPTRYVLLEKNQVKNFKEDQLEVFQPKRLAGRSNRQMVAYYNVLNILGDRMQKKPTTTIKLVGSSEQGIDDGKAMAESVKKYLNKTFDIESSRISTEGANKPAIPSGIEGGTKDLDLISEGNRRVTIETASPTLLMEFQSGPDAPLKPVELIGVQQAPIDSYVTFSVDGDKDPVTTWSIEAKDDKGTVQNFGPFTKKQMSLPGKTILGTRAEGDYIVTMNGKTKSGKDITKQSTMHMVLWTPPTDEQGERYSVIFDYNEAKATSVYEKYLLEVVMPKIPKGGIVIIHGYTDIIGGDDYNEKLSLARANGVKSTLEKGLANAGRSDVKFELFGFGENENLSPFENKFPEERFYNRTVVIDLIPKK